MKDRKWPKVEATSFGDILYDGHLILAEIPVFDGDDDYGLRQAEVGKRLASAWNACADIAHPEKLEALLEACLDPPVTMVLDGVERYDVRYCNICGEHISAAVRFPSHIRDGEISPAFGHWPDCDFNALGYQPKPKETP
jgi:hypothetical protein